MKTIKGTDFRDGTGQVELVYDCVRKCYFHPQIKDFVFWVQGAFSYHARIHPSNVAGLQKHIGYLPGQVSCTWGLEDWKGVESFCTWAQIWDEENQVHVTKIVSGTDRYGSTLYVEARFIELSTKKLLPVA